MEWKGMSLLDQAQPRVRANEDEHRRAVNRDWDLVVSAVGIEPTTY